jgi:hypothetical protein
VRWEPIAPEPEPAGLRQSLHNLLDRQRLGVLSSVAGEQPYASLVAIAASPDLSRIYFATSRSTRKYANLEANPRAAMLIDNRSNQARDFRQAMAATATGRVEELTPGAEAAFGQFFTAKHPYLDDFISAPSTAKFCLRVKTYFVVNRFQNVMELHVDLKS